MRKSGIALLFALFVLSLYFNSLASAVSKSGQLMIPRVNSIGSLSVNAQKKHYPNWCWASCGSSIAQLYGKINTTQTDFYTAIRGTSVPVQDYYLPSIADIPYGLRKFGVQSTSRSATVDIAYQIESNRSPVVVRWNIKSTNKGHAVLAYAFSDYGNTILYVETDTGVKKALSLSAMTDNSIHKWTHSVYNCRK